jgi:hypothetical protein
MREVSRGGQVKAERAALGISKEILARWVGCRLDALVDYETDVRMPTPAMEREVQFALHNAQCLRCMGVPLDGVEHVEKILEWMRGGRLWEEREETRNEMVAAGEAV